MTTGPGAGEGRLRRGVERYGAYAGLALAAGLPAPVMLELGTGAYLWAALCLVTIGAACALAQPAGDRRAFLGLLWFSWLARLVLLCAVQGWAQSAGGPFLGPDSTTYYDRSTDLAVYGYTSSLAPALYFGSYDSAHYYLFAAQVRYWGADLFALQFFNAGLTGLAGPLAFSIVRIAYPRYAVAAGLTVAFYPSLIALGVNDLLKDPGVIAGSTLALWTVAQAVWVETRWTRRLAFAVVAALVLSYVRMSRGYAGGFIEISLIGAVIVGYHVVPRQRLNRAAAATLASILLVVELLPWALGWPLSPVIMTRQTRHSLNSPGMYDYAPGLVDRAVSRPGPSERRDQVSRRAGRDVPGRPSRGSDGGVSGSGAPGRAEWGEAPVDGAQAEPVTGVRRAATFVANGFRKLFGPYPWVMPPSWDARTILEGDYLLFPGMLVWYAVLPLALAGLALTCVGLARRAAQPPVAVAAAGLIACLGVMYLVLNLSYRQREFMFPFLLLACCVAYERCWSLRAARAAYAVYWLGLATLATAHLTLRGLLAG